MALRDRLNPKHTVVGEGYRLMTGAETLTETDGTARVSLLLSPDGDTWEPLATAYPEAVGVTVDHVCTGMGDMDGRERVFRRRITVECPLCNAQVRVIATNGDGCVDCITRRRTVLAAYRGWKANEVEVARMIAGMKAQGAHYPDDNFYGLVHETAHGVDLGLPDADPMAINIALSERTEWERLQAEVVAKSVARWASAFFHTPQFPDPVRYAAVSVKKFAERDGTKVSWTPEDFVDETVRQHNGTRVRDAINAVMLKLIGYVDGTK